uniref:Uncharacterized protein n=1 Tax=Anguilla anguilla TaxID=7936 RepID=A0A0E9R7T9_ANGAN
MTPVSEFTDTYEETVKPLMIVSSRIYETRAFWFQSASTAFRDSTERPGLLFSLT